ncbi:MAG: TonB-dependent receptor plug domain-containing protein [Phycisphaera sp.]|nr:TonB-dependent receptor plug domain-containing protein [Phycisphaera sp.]
MVKRRLWRWVSGGTAMFIAATVWAQQMGSIRGVVYDKDFQAPLAGAVVTVAETGEKAAANEQGAYSIQLPPGTYNLVFSKDGYTSTPRSNVVVSEGQLTEVEVLLSGDFTDMDEFVVPDFQIGGPTEAGLLNLQLNSPQFLNSIGSELIGKSGRGNAADALTLVSGATVQDGKFAVIRGLPDRYVNSQLNGVRLPSADDKTRAVELDQFPSAVIESIQISKTFTPDQQGDASGGAVNLILKGIPDQNIFQFNASIGYNTQTTGRSDFLTYEGGGVNLFGFNPSNTRQVQSKWFDRTSANDGMNAGAVGVTRGEAPVDYKLGFTVGGSHSFENDVKLGALFSFFYERDSSSYQNGINDQYSQDPSGTFIPLVKNVSNDGYTSLFDESQSSSEVKWGGLSVVGLEWAEQKLKFVYLYTRAAEDTATLAEDTRGKAYFYPGYDPADPTSNGWTSTFSAPYRRDESLAYTERTTQSFQFSGQHKLPIFDEESDSWFDLKKPEFDWTFSLNDATFFEPDKRFLSTIWVPGNPSDPSPFSLGRHIVYSGSGNSNLGNLQRIFRDIREDDTQYQVNLKLPFTQWSNTEGYLKLGIFSDMVDRKYNQDSFTNPSVLDSNQVYYGPFTDLWSTVWPSQAHRTVLSRIDVDYTGKFEVNAFYAMMDLPLTSWFKLIGGARFESTEISTDVSPYVEVRSGREFIRAFYIPPPPPLVTSQVLLNPADVADAHFSQDDILPALSFVLNPVPEISLRGSYTQTVARQTFRELSPIQQQDYLGGDIFVGNNTLQMSALENYDLRLDFQPRSGTFFSVSYFLKDIQRPIEYIQRYFSGTGTFTTAVNYPEGKIRGWELELRQDLAAFDDNLQGLSFGGNATLITSEVSIPEYEQDQSVLFGFPRRTTRDATNAPELLYNIYMIYAIPDTGTEFSIFYTVRGDTLVAGSAIGNGGLFIPDLYEKEYGTLNLSVSQKIGEHFKLKFQAKNLTDPMIQRVYRGEFNAGDVVHTSYTKGIDLSLSFSADFEF